ncbi:DNA topoisomerase 3 [Salmonella enterica]|nr:DNA topoisomerase III [Salmonella enterica]ECX3453345.1 DNA topoisomerase III [Salmonella enterica subsp. enterica serovar Rubislaw]EDU8270003.1 DNA topoisomerase III [Salmonella enterica subsp. enterica serovar Java]EAO9770361.1 DNA topoisomerase III [Salmonella enterica]EAS2244586.1 DNA topoisomerase III [Salmonella enterica]
MNISTLWIAEKPSMAEAFASQLGVINNKDHSLGAYVSQDKSVVVTWLYGHLVRDLMPEEYDPEMKSWKLETLPFFPQNWKKTPRENVVSHFQKVKKLIQAATNIVLATDFDREGEVIGRELLDECGYRGKVERVNITGTDAKSISKCIENRFDGNIGLPLYYAGKGRERADWLVGLNFTRAITVLGRQKGLKETLSAGRVQSATVKIIVDRENDVQGFKSQDHYQVKVHMQHGDVPFTGKWQPLSSELDDNKLLLDKEIASRKVVELSGQDCTVRRSIAQTSERSAPLPFNLSAAQIECANKYGFGVQKTLDILQSLYDTHKLTTYPRTDCRYLPTAELDELDAKLQAIVQMDPTIEPVISALDLTLRSDAWNDDKVGAHFGLIPTAHCGDLSRLKDDELLVYKLVRDNFISQFMATAKYRNVTLEIAAGDDRIVASSSTLVSPGWLEFIKPVKDDDADEEQNQTVPELKEGSELKIKSAEIISKKTSAPKYFTEATLLAAMNNCAGFVKDPGFKKILKSTCGIGTEATRAGIIKILFDRSYIVKKGKQIRPTQLAISLMGVLPDEISSIERTAYWEQQLDAIAQRKLSLDEFMCEVTGMVKDIFSKGFADINLDKVIPKCPVCNKNLIRRKGVNGFFWGCSGYPECKKTFNDKKGKPDFSKNNKKVK